MHSHFAPSEAMHDASSHLAPPILMIDSKPRTSSTDPILQPFHEANATHPHTTLPTSRMVISHQALRLPTELWEMVIRCIVQHPEHPSSPIDYYPPLLVCALTCNSWLEASQHALYHTVRLRSYNSVLLFVRTITEDEWFASLVREVSIDPGMNRMIHTCSSALCDARVGHRVTPIEFATYIPFAHSTLISKLRLLRRLELRSLNMTRDYPPFFSRQLTRFPGPIHELILWNCSLPLIQMFQLLWSLKNLRRLSLVAEITTAVAPVSSLDCLKLQDMQAVRPRACSQLRELELGVSGCAWSL